MKAKDLLALIDEDFSDQNVAFAIEWLKKKKPTNNTANEILLYVMFHPLMLKESEWLKNRLQETDWEIFEHSFHGLKSIEHLEFMLELLHENPVRPDAGYVWAGLLNDFRHKDLEPGALEWLKNAKEGDRAINAVLKQLLRLNPDPALVQQAKEILKKEFDLFLLVELIKHRGDKESYAEGAKVLNGDENPHLKQMVAHAMAQSNGNQNLEPIQMFLADKKAQKLASRFLLELAETNSELFELVCEWISQNLNTAAAKDRLSKPLFVIPSVENALRLWNWFKKESYNDARFEVMVRLIDNAWCPLNEEAETYVSEWIKKNPEHKLCKFAQSALTRTIENRFAYLHGPLKDVLNMRIDDDGSINIEELRKLVEYFDPGDAKDDKELQQALFKWMEKSKSECESLKTQFDMFRKSKRAEDFNLFSINLEVNNLSFKELILGGIVLSDEDEIVGIALEALNGPKLLRRWNIVHKYQGALILQMLKAFPKNKDLKAHAESWLAIRPDKFEHKIFKELTRILQKQ